MENGATDKTGEISEGKGGRLAAFYVSYVLKDNMASVTAGRTKTGLSKSHLPPVFF